MKDKSYGKLEWFIYAGLIPFIFLVIFCTIVLYFLGYNVTETAVKAGQKVPGLSLILSDSDQDQMEIEQMKTDLQQAEQHINQQVIEIERLEAELNQRNEEIISLHSQLEELEFEQENVEAEDEEQKASVRELSTIYARMSGSRAAGILERLTLQETALILNQMDESQQSNIMGKLDPQYAANLTVIMRDRLNSDDLEMAALQERIDTLMESLDDDQSSLSVERVANTIERMSPEDAAMILVDMATSDSSQEAELSLQILAHVEDRSRSSILSQMDPDQASQYISQLVE